MEARLIVAAIERVMFPLKALFRRSLLHSLLYLLLLLLVKARLFLQGRGSLLQPLLHLLVLFLIQARLRL